MTTRRLVSLTAFAATLALVTVAIGQPVASFAAPAPAAPSAVLTPPTIKVMPLGDSITWGKGAIAANSDGYRADLYERLTSAGMKVDFVGSMSNGAKGTDTDHEGHPGWTIAQISAQMAGWLTTYKPDVILLHLGANDIKTLAGSVGAPARLVALVDKIRKRAPAAHIFVAKITGSTNAAVQARINTFNLTAASIVTKRGMLVHPADQSSIRGLALRDYLHPNDFGYMKMAYNWYRALRPVFQAKGTVWPAGTNPYAATRAVLCINKARFSSSVRCNMWQRVNVKQKYNLRIAAEYKVTTVRGKKVSKLVAAHTVVRTRTVKKWIIR